MNYKEDYKKIINDINFAIIIQYKNEIIHYNNKASELFSCNENCTLYGKNYIDFVSQNEKNDIYFIPNKLVQKDKVKESKRRTLYDFNGNSFIAEVYIIELDDYKNCIVINDITNVINREKRIFEDQDNFKLLTKYSNDIILRIDFTNGIIFSSDSIERFTGYEQDEILHKNPLLFFYTNKDKRKALECIRVLKNKKYTSFLFMTKHKNGNSIWMDVTLSGIYDDLGRLIEVLAIMRDFTKRKFAQKRLKDKMNFIDNILNSLSDLVFVVDEYGFISMTNITANKKLNFCDFNGKNINDFIVEYENNCESYDCINKNIEKVPFLKENNKHAYMIKNDGKLIPVIIKCNEKSLNDGKYVITVNDISEKQNYDLIIRTINDAQLYFIEGKYNDEIFQILLNRLITFTKCDSGIIVKPNNVYGKEALASRKCNIKDLENNKTFNEFWEEINNKKMFPQKMNLTIEGVYKKCYLIPIYDDKTLEALLVLKSDDLESDIIDLTSSYLKPAYNAILAIVKGIKINIDKENILNELKSNQEKLKTIVETLHEGVTLRDENGNILLANSSAEKMFNIPLGEHKNVSDSNKYKYHIKHYDGSPLEFKDMPANIVLNTGKSVINYELLLSVDETKEIYVIVNSEPVRDNNNKLIGVVTSFFDITENKKREKDVEYLANYDQLTKIPNRRYFEEILNQEIENKNRFALLMFDVDNFKRINDVHGHHIGDAFLKDLTSELSKNLESSDVLSRVAGDEFTIILKNDENKNNYEYIEKYIKTIHEIFNKNYIIDDIVVKTTTSIGIVTYPDQGKNIYDLMMYADTAMYYAKSGGRSRHVYFKENMIKELENKKIMENKVYDAHSKNKLLNYYQPVINIENNIIDSIEAFVRFDDGERVFLPNDFISVAEESNLIIQITDKVIENACYDYKNYISKYIDTPISVNISPNYIKLFSDELINKLETITKKFDVNPNRLIYELNENAFIDFRTNPKNSVKELNKKGVSICINDYGIGFSSLKIFNEINVKRLKVDITYIHSMDNDISYNIVEAAFKLGESLNMKTIAVGVENEEQYRKVKEIGYKYIQGNYLVSPTPKDKLVNYLDDYTKGQ